MFQKVLIPFLKITIGMLQPICKTLKGFRTQVPREKLTKPKLTISQTQIQIYHVSLISLRYAHNKTWYVQSMSFFIYLKVSRDSKYHIKSVIFTKHLSQYNHVSPLYKGIHGYLTLLVTLCSTLTSLRTVFCLNHNLLELKRLRTNVSVSGNSFFSIGLTLCCISKYLFATSHIPIYSVLHNLPRK